MKKFDLDGFIWIIAGMVIMAAMTLWLSSCTNISNWQGPDPIFKQDTNVADTAKKGI